MQNTIIRSWLTVAVLIAAAICIAPAPSYAGTAAAKTPAQILATQEKNKQIVTDFYTKIIIQGDFEAGKKYFGDRYIQHNPYAPNGPEALKKFLDNFKGKLPNAHTEIKHIYADGDYVILHVFSTSGEPGDHGSAIVDIFKLEDFKVVEHLDVIQSIPATSANDNTMF